MVTGSLSIVFGGTGNNAFKYQFQVITCQCRDMIRPVGTCQAENLKNRRRQACGAWDPHMTHRGGGTPDAS